MYRIMFLIIAQTLITNASFAETECETLKTSRQQKIFKFSSLQANSILTKKPQDIAKLLTQTPDEQKQDQSPELRGQLDSLNKEIDAIEKQMKEKKCPE
jgi:hypothetical protein